MSGERIRGIEACAQENCGSRLFHLGEDGFTYCDRGHQQSERGTITAEDPGEYRTPGRTSRRRTSEAESTTSRASSFSGVQAFEHHLLCVQFVLRKQLKWLIDVQQLPHELETIVRDLWALRLQTCARTAAQASGSDTEGPSSSSQVFSSQSESESASASRSSRRGKKASIRNVESASSLVDTLVCCYIGMLLLRLPVTVADIHRWTNEGDLLYYRASREIALNVRERLPGRYQRMLEPEHLLKPQDLHGHVLETLKAMHKRYGMAMPVINTSLVLFRWVKMLALPLETFAAAQRLARMLDIEIAFQLEVKAVALRHPEAQLMALLVVATKLLFPPDDIERCAATSTDLCALVFDWQAWVAIQEKQLQRGIEPCSLSFEQAFNFEESDCVEAADDRLDAYLDWYQDNIATEKIREHGQAGNDAELRRTMFRLFPTAHQKTTATQSTNITARDEMDGSTRLTQTMLTPRNLRGTDTANAHAVGTFYSRFRNAEELSGPVKVLYERAAVLASLSLDGMVQAVFLTERRVQKYEDGLRKSTKQGRASRDID